MTPNDEERSPLYSIGVVSEKTGILDTTLRIWERRYGVPAPVRLPSGHRRYTAEQIRWLRHVAEGLALGLRPGRALKASRDELAELVARRRPPVEQVLPEGWEACVRNFQRAPLERALAAALERLGLAPFLDRCIGAMLECAGTYWADGKLEVRHERFMTEVVEDFLRKVRAEASRQHREPRSRLVLATLPDELHSIGLLMFSCLCAAESVGFHSLGTSMPIEDVLGATAELRADGVALSVSTHSSGPGTFRQVTRMRQELPEHCHLLVGGGGARRYRRSPAGVHLLHSFTSARRTLRRLFVTSTQVGEEAV